MTEHSAMVPLESIAQSILVLRGQRVILDSELARLYGVETKRLNEQVRRNRERFPEDFLFQLDEGETKCLRSHFATSNVGRGGRRTRPYAFTEHGALMAASVLNTPRAVEVSVYVVRAFVRLREVLSTHAELAQKLAELEERVSSHDEQIVMLIEAIREMLAPPESPQRRLGFRTGESADSQCLAAVPISEQGESA